MLHNSLSIRICSDTRALLNSKGLLNAGYSTGRSPEATPITKRLGKSTSRLAEALATCKGWRSGKITLAIPNLMLLVSDAICDKYIQGSNICPTSLKSGLFSGISRTHTVSKPKASARCISCV